MDGLRLTLGYSISASNTSLYFSVKVIDLAVGTLLEVQIVPLYHEFFTAIHNGLRSPYRTRDAN
ncbi:hypothetical protein AY601_1778 [Pedobacter cryoconitis]|uniref:Uncharacterized protein n=1 Tax=Pedobacter cryoconitis TaxID=188932 RepID=A0A127VBV1_9SPHI|nr:hypothetical protein AY601_1778 [Pedobacter cryoconitis]